MIAPFVEELAVEYDGKLNVAKMDVDANPRTAMQYGIRSIPTLMVFKNGQVVEQIIGAVPKRHLVEKVKPHLIERDMISHSIRDKEFEEAVLNANE